MAARVRAARAGVSLGMVVVVLSSAAPALAAGNARPLSALAAGPIVAARASEPVVITGSQIPSWSRAAAAVAAIPPQPYGISSQFGGDNARSAHNGILTLPPDARAGIDPDQVAAYRWDGTSWTEVPVQVDQRYPYLLANGHSSFSFYSGTSREITYAWNPTAHSTGEESWKKVFGGITGITDPTFHDPNPCVARYQLAGAAGLVELAQAKANQVVSPPTFPGVPPDDYTGPMPSPADTVDASGTLHAHLTDDDEIAMMARDAGLLAPQGTAPPTGTSNGQTVTIVDPTSGTPGDPSAQTSYIYLFLQPGGSSFNSTNGYVQMTRDNGTDTPANNQPNADTWIDRYNFAPSDTEKIGTSNTGYGPNIGGDVCRTSAGNDANPHITTPDGQPRPTARRGPRDGVTITTPTYHVYASGRWMVRQYGITAPGTAGAYGPNLISRWKGRAFQSSPDSSISVVGFEDEQVNWELNGALLGWKSGPVRAIRETWGADSGTNVTKTEVYYRDADVYHYHVRVHPIPPDGLYTAWDYRLGVVSTYYNLKVPAGVPIDGTNTANVGQVNQVPVSGQPAFLDACDPATQICTAILNPEEIAGPNGGMVYITEIVGPSTAGQPAVVPYYRDDACFDDGTGDGPPPRPWPKESSTDSRVEQGYVDYWHARGMPVTGVLATDYAQLKCQPAKVGDPLTPAWQQTPFTGAIGQNGIHYFFTTSTDQNINEIDAQQWRFAVPMSLATNVTQPYGQNVQAKLQAVVTPYGSTAVVAEAPAPAFLLLVALPVVGLVLLIRRRREASTKLTSHR
jgi:hypothetical protein